MHGRRLALLATALLLSGCGGWQSDGEEGIESADFAAEESNLVFMGNVPADELPPDTIGLPMKQIMTYVFQQTADDIWQWHGVTPAADNASALEAAVDGNTAQLPATDAEWTSVRNQALTLAELTNILLLPGRRVDDPRWAKAVADVRAISLRIARAAERKDEGRFLAGGDRLDVACRSCHEAFAPWSVALGGRAVPAAGVTNEAVD